jgi:hypothetical protein
MGNFAFGDVRFRTGKEKLLASNWSPISYNDTDITAEGDVQWQQTDAGDIVVHGNGTLIIPQTSSFNAIRFDTKINGQGDATISLGGFNLFIATQGDQKTGSILGHPIRANLVDQNEWCTIEINQENGTVVSINDVPIITGDDSPSMKTNEIRIDVHDVELSLRRTYIKSF